MTQFSPFKPIELADYDALHPRFWAYQPQTSEINFANLFIWREHYNLQWTLYEEWLILLAEDVNGDAYGLPPVGPANRSEVTRAFLTWLRDTRGSAAPRIERADARLVAELSEDEFTITPTRDHFDYVYEREALATLSGRKYSNKRNHINAFMREQEYTYEPLTADNVAACLKMACIWCQMYRCKDDLSLTEECEAVREALEHFTVLPLKGGVIRVEGQVQAFTIGEHLNSQTAVIHIEKANPEIRGLYPLINREFVRTAWEEVAYINREQDLGEPGLRRAKKSYYPERLEEKYRVTLA